MHKKLLIIPFIAVLIVSMIFLSTQIPMSNMEPKDVPIGLVVADDGPLAQTLNENFSTMLAENKTLKVTTFDTEQAMLDALNNRDIYGAIMIPTGFSAAVQSLATATPQAAQMQYFINQGHNANVSTLLTNVFTQMNSQINNVVRTQVLGQLQQANTPLQVTQIEPFVQPVTANFQNVNATGDLSTAPTAFFQPTWFAAILAAVLLFFAGKKANFQTKREQLQFNGVQTIVAIVYAFVAGYFITWASTWILNFEYNNFHTVALFTTMACLAFLWLIQASLTWLGLPVIAVYVLLMFYGLPLIQLAPEMLSNFYQDYVVSWIPFKFYIEGLKDIFYFGADVTNSNFTVLLWIAIVSLIVLWIKHFINKIKINVQ